MTAMQSTIIFSLCVSTIFATTTVSDLDNSVYSKSDTSSTQQFSVNVPENNLENVPENTPINIPENVPVSRCFSNVPLQDDVNINNIDTSTVLPIATFSDPIPPQFTPYNSPEPSVFPPQPEYNPFINRNYYPFNNPLPAGPGPFQKFPDINRPPLVIVKLLQPIILPVARPLIPEMGMNNLNSDEPIFRNKFVSRKFGPQRYTNFGRPIPYRRNSVETLKSDNVEENIYIRM